MRAVNRAAGRLAAPVAARVTRPHRPDRLTVVGWHRIGPGGGLSTSYDDFRRHLDVLAAWGAHVLPLDVAVDRLGTADLPPRTVALTFDDGYASVLEQAWPELQRRGLPATLFAVSGYLDGRGRFPWDRGASAAECRIADAAAVRAAAAAGLAIGSHTVTHRWLPELEPADAERELKESRHDLEDLLGREVVGFAYPMGGWTDQVRQQVAAAGYRFAVTVDRGRNRPGTDPHALHRAFAFDRPVDFHRQLDGAFYWMRPLERWRSARGPR
jgi:peptidoglycan/xylan/chitin deacetylase (PgdA/CDA1 family)